MLSQASPETQLLQGHLSNPLFSSRSSRSIPPCGPSKVQPFCGFPSSQCPWLLRSASSPHPRSIALLRLLDSVGWGLDRNAKFGAACGPFQDPRVGMPFLFMFGTRRHFPLCCHLLFLPLFFSGLWALEDSRGSRHSLRKLWTSRSAGKSIS